jgi:predicted transcriptional regulator
MRTTITLDDGLLDQLKRRASETGTSVSKLVEQAVRLFVRTPRSSASSESFELVTFGAGGRFSQLNIDKTSALIEADDRDRFGSSR